MNDQTQFPADTVQDEGDIRTRKRRIKLKETRREVSDLARKLRRIVHGATAIALLLYLAWDITEMVVAMRSYGPITLYTHREDLRYALGSPTHGGANEPVWTYLQQGRLITVHFAGDTVTGSSCTQLRDAQEPCPDILRLDTGSTGQDVAATLGWPSQTVMQGDDKILTYAGLGYAFHLHQDRVTGIEHIGDIRLSSMLMTAAWRAIP